MGFIGDIIDRMSNTQIMVGLISFIILVGSIGAGAYLQAQKEGEIPCLSCLALNPEVEGFSGDWWVNYPSSFEKAGQPVSHLSWVKTSLQSYDVVMLFFWQHGCDACEEQWEDMKDSQIVKGTESSGSMDKYSSDVKLYSLDIGTDRGRDAFDTYALFKGTKGTPTTTFLITLPGGKIGWFSYLGYMAPKDVDAMLHIAMHG